MKENEIDYRFQQLQKLNRDIPFELVVEWVLAAKIKKQKAWWKRLFRVSF